MPELNAILLEGRKQIESERRFLAALQGVDIDAGATDDAFKRVQDRARAKVEEMTGVELADPMMGEFIANGIEIEQLVEIDNG